MSLGPKQPPRPIILHVDDVAYPQRFAEASAISVSSFEVDTVSSFGASTITFLSPISVATISAQTYLGAAAGGVTYFSALQDTPSTYNNGQIVVYNSTGLTSIVSSTFALSTSLSDYIPTSVSSTFALDSDLSSYIPTSVSSTFALDTDLANYIPTSVSSTFALDSDLDSYLLKSVSAQFASSSVSADYIPRSVSSTFALNTDLNNYIPTSVSSSFAQTASLANYIPTSVSSTYAQSSDLNNHTASNVHWTRTQLNFDYINTSGDTFTGTINGISALFNTVSATTYLNVPSTGGGSPSGAYSSIQFNNDGSFSGTSSLVWDSVNNRLLATTISATTYINVSAGTITSATTTEIGGIKLNGNIDTYLDGSGNWVLGLDASTFVTTSGASMTGGLSGLNTSAYFETISATTYINLPAGSGGGVSAFSSLNDTFVYSGKGGNIVIVKPNETGLSSIVSSTFATASQLSNYIPTSVSSTFALDTDLTNYIPTSVSSSYAQSSDLNNHTASAVHWSLTQLNTNYVNTSGDTMTGTLNGISALFTNVSATTYHNVTATVGSATTTAIGGLQLNGQVNTFYNGSGQWVSGVDTSAVMHTSGGTFTGSVTGTSAILNTVSATNYKYLPVSKGVSILNPSADDEITVFIAPSNHRISNTYGILKGTGPSATIEFYVSGNRTGTTPIGSMSFNNTTTYYDASSNVTADMSVGSMLWMKISAISGTVSELHTTIDMIRL